MRTRTLASAQILMIAVSFMIAAILGAFCWPYAINSWLIYLGKAAALKWWQGALLGIIPGIGQICLPLAIFTFLIMLFLV
jgi:hypothetical protein